MRGIIGLAAVALLVLSAGAGRADEGRKVDCKETNLEFASPGFTVECKDFSRNSVSVGTSNAGTRVFSLFAVSEADLTYLQAYSKAILGGTRFYINKRSLESELAESYGQDFSNWGDEDDIGDFEVKHVTVTFKSGEPAECIAFQKLGARRYSGVAGLTAGYACSDSGRDHAFEAVKRFVSQQ